MKHIYAIVTVYDTDEQLDADTPARVRVFRRVVDEGTGETDQTKTVDATKEGADILSDAELAAVSASVAETAERLHDDKGDAIVVDADAIVDKP